VNILECEYHILPVCPKYRDLRINFPHFTIVIGQLIINWNHYYCQNLKLVPETIAKYIYQAH